ncbi:choice-of-anchor O protein [Planctomycetes bacterium Poly30]|uniref:choice-of-anchor O protein n=1 Tax=Saltatorellus ferox TaxID=2528018 RepID=UPI00119E26A0
MKPAFLLSLTPLLLLSTAGQPAAAHPQEQASFSLPVTLSEELPAGAIPGGAASKGKLVRLVKTMGGARDGRLITVYGDAASTEEVWDAKSGLHRVRDLFVRYSDDEGATWTQPVNISNTAAHHSASCDWDGDGQPETFHGDSEKPNIFNSGDIVVVSWIDAYCPEATVAWGSDAESAIQGRAVYASADVYPNVREVPFKAPYVAISYDGGETFEYGAVQPPIQLTYGRRDAKQDVQRGVGARWAMSWQEDPEGLQAGSADGPGDGASGAKVTKGTDVWYSYTEDILASPLDLRLTRTPLTNQSEYDTTETNGFPIRPLAGGTGGGGTGGGGTLAGSIQNTGCSRGNLGMVKVGTSYVAVVAYEETKGVPLIEEGKTIQYHSFPFNAPIMNGSDEHRHGAPGTQLTPQQMNSRRVRFVTQGPNGSDPALVIFWKQGLTTEGGPSDIFVKSALSFDEAAVAAAPALNVSTNTPSAVPADMLLDSQANPIEDSNAHRAVLRGNLVVLGWCYTWNGPLARYTDLANYNFYSRRSLDGGVTWDAPVNVSNVLDTKVTVREPRLVAPAKTGMEDGNSLIAAWGTETNVYDGIGVAMSLDAQFTRTRDQAGTWEKVVPMSAAASMGEFESQIRVDDSVDEVYALVMASDAAGSEALFTHGRVVDVPATIGTIVCLGDGTGTPCPCGNESATDTGEGCMNSTGRGALLTATGSDSVAADDLLLGVEGLPSSTFALLFMAPNYGPYFSSGFMNGDGLTCLGSPAARVAIVQADAAGVLQFPTGLASTWTLDAGDTGVFQAGYRDASSTCGFGFNITNALSVSFQP